MRFQREHKKVIERVSEKQLRYFLGFRRAGDATYAILDDGDGNYMQMLGGGVACCLEWHDYTSRQHWRAYNDPPRVPWKEESLLGQMRLNPEEFIFIEQVIDSFVAFLKNMPFPNTLQWRDVTIELEAGGMAWEAQSLGES